MVSTISPEGEARQPVRPSARFMRARASRWIALGFGSGLSPRAPGTVGTLWAWLVFVAFDPLLSPVLWAVVLALAFAVGVPACERTARDLGVADHGAIVWDEVVAFWLVLLFVPAGWQSQLAAFVLFRFFDIVKPPPIRHYDAKLKGGFGVMLDDLLAALYTLFVFALFDAWVGGAPAG
ncbi:phosphatidylglycerophosphatase A [Burkholderiaceae bacterium FT117]|uniref:phosphatidylglycerophosphatase A family protein n=1 Tax=Zeimonas sediminis TaxID=2944268 RepID=UPI002342C93F|nr:phosphatidylglycerophosphatase A [Zeimonas sediminis]MCM5572413.1 phosphatidylglycerophosphatase A [Zeimonas sediminis]